MTEKNNNDSILANAVNKRAEALSYTGLSPRILQSELIVATMNAFPIKTFVDSPEEVIPFINSWQPDPDFYFLDYQRKIMSDILDGLMPENQDKTIDNR